MYHEKHFSRTSHHGHARYRSAMSTLCRGRRFQKPYTLIETLRWGGRENNMRIKFAHYMYTYIRRTCIHTYSWPSAVGSIKLLWACKRAPTHRHVYMHGCTHTFTYTHIDTYTHISYTYIRTHTYTHAHIHTHVLCVLCACAHMCRYMHGCAHTCSHIHAAPHIYIYIYIHILHQIHNKSLFLGDAIGCDTLIIYVCMLLI